MFYRFNPFCSFFIIPVKIILSIITFAFLFFGLTLFWWLWPFGFVCIDFVVLPCVRLVCPFCPLCSALCGLILPLCLVVGLILSFCPCMVWCYCFALMQSNVVALLSGMVWICLWLCLFSLILTESPYLWCIHFLSFFIPFSPFYHFFHHFHTFSYLLTPFHTHFSLFFFYGRMYAPCLTFWRKREKWAKKYVYACGWVSMYLFLMYCSGRIVVAWLCCVVYLILLPAKCEYACGVEE